ncbi:MAG: hypothetical protein AB2693_26905 [Candidatus Thiodiazotropha sp.]
MLWEKKVMERLAWMGERFADGIDVLAEEEQELEVLMESLDKTYTSMKWK